MVNTVEWHSLGVMAAEGMSLRVGAFRASDGEVVEFSSDVLKKIFNKVKDPVPMYLTHKDAGTDKARVVLGHAVKLGLEADGDKVHYKALMMDPAFKMVYAEGYDDTSAEIDPIRDDAGNIIDGTLTGIAVVPNPAISGTEMAVSAIAFSDPGSSQQGGIKLTGNKLERMLLESGVPTDKVSALVEGMELHFSKHFEQAGLQKEFEKLSKDLEFAKAETEQVKKGKEEVEKKFEDLTKEYETHLGTTVDALIGEVRTIGFANPEKVVEGLPVQQQIAMLSRMKENMITAKPASTPAVGLEAAKPTSTALKTLEENLAELGCNDLWNKTHPVTKEA